VVIIDAVDSRLRKIYWKHTVIIDLVVLTIAFILALCFRYFVFAGMYKHAPTISGMYLSLYIILVLLHTIIYYINRDKWNTVPQQSAIENVVTVFKMQFYLFACLLAYLFLAKWSNNVSRSVIGFFFLLNFIFDSIARIWYKKRIEKKTKSKKRKKKLLIVTDKEHKDLIENQLALNETVIEKDTVLIDTFAKNNDENDDKCAKDTSLLSQNAFKENVAICLKNVSGDSYNQAYIYLPAIGQDNVFEIAYILEQKNIPSHVILTALGSRIGNKNIHTNLGFQVLSYSAMMTKGYVLGVKYTVSNIAEAVFYVRNHLEKLSGKYICFSNVHTTVMAHDRSDVLEAENSSALTFPDGAPIARLLKHDTDVNALRMAGPDFMEEMLISSMDGKTSHYFYGSSEETLKALKQNIEAKYKGVVVKGYYSPPFRTLSEEEKKADIDMINAADADIIWIGLGAPKQELWMLEHKDKFRGVMVGVGAAFDFHAGTIKRAPKWMQMLSLEWLYRLMQNPGRLFKRYFVTNLRFIYLAMLKKSK